MIDLVYIPNFIFTCFKSKDRTFVKTSGGKYYFQCDGEECRRGCKDFIDVDPRRLHDEKIFYDVLDKGVTIENGTVIDHGARHFEKTDIYNRLRDSKDRFYYVRNFLDDGIDEIRVFRIGDIFNDDYKIDDDESSVESADEEWTNYIRRIS